MSDKGPKKTKQKKGRVDERDNRKPKLHFKMNQKRKKTERNSISVGKKKQNVPFFGAKI